MFCWAKVALMHMGACFDLAVSSSQALGGIYKCLDVFWLSGPEEVLQACNGQRSGKQLSTLHSTGQP